METEREGKLTRDLFHEGSSNLAQNPGDDQGQREEPAVGNPRRSPADSRHHSTARIAGASRAARCQARRRPHLLLLLLLTQSKFSSKLYIAKNRN